jgi:hypothetical protein
MKDRPETIFADGKIRDIKTGDRREYYSRTHGSLVIVPSVTCF